MGNIFDCAANPLAPLPGQTPDDAHSNADGVAKFYDLEAPCRLSESVLWRLQKTFYQNQGINAWSNGIVPNFVTSNAYIARAYAKVIFGLLKDIYVHKTIGTPSEPMYIIETGAGHGKLAYLILEALLRWEDFLPRGDDGKPPFVYVLTDVGQKPIDDWQNHFSLQPLFQSSDGIELLDFAVYDAVKDDKINLQLRGIELNSTTLKNPPLFISNYVFDSLPMDAFRVIDGKLQEALVTASCPTKEENLDDPEIISRVRCTWKYAPVEASTDIYDDSELDAIVKYYATKFSNASFLLPVGALRMLRNIRMMSNGNAIIIAGDKGYLLEDELIGQREPHVAIHGSFSLMVNFHAIRLWIERTAVQRYTNDHKKEIGGALRNSVQPYGFMETTRQLEGFKCASMYLGCDTKSVNQARFMWQDAIVDFTPEDFSSLQRKVREEIPNPSLRLVLALLRLAAHDSDVFCKFRAILIEKAALPYSNDAQAQDIKKIDLERVHAVYYPLQDNKDVCFEMARLLMGLKEYSAAIEFFEKSVQMCGEHHVTYHNMGMCYYYMDLLPQSLEMFRASLSMNPQYGDARMWLEKVTHRMHAAGFDDMTDDDLDNSDSELSESRASSSQESCSSDSE